MAKRIEIEDRRKQVSELLRTHGTMTLAQLRQALGIGENTIRRDLEELERQGVARRTYGGAVHMAALMAQDGQRPPPPMAEQKVAIAAAVAPLVQDGQTVILDGGTTCYQVAAALQGRHISVVTNSVLIADRLSGEIATEVTIVGGLLYPRVGVALGDTAVRQLAGIRASLLILSCAGIEPDGVFNTNQMMVDVERRMMESADQVVLAADSSKFTKRGLARLCGLADLDAIVTDAGLTAEAHATLTSAGVRVVIAGGETKVAS